MAVENRQKPKTRPSAIKSIVMNTFCIVFLGWLILTFWCFFLWASQGFDASYRAIGDIAARQAFIFSASSPASLASHINIPFNQNALEALVKARVIQEDITEKASDRIRDFTSTETFVAPEFQGILEDLKLKASQFFILARAAAKLLVIKLCIMLFAIPLFALAITAGLVDGLSQRAIRTASLGRESTWVFHQSIPVARKILFLILALWLAIPYAMHPSPLFAGLSVLLGLLSSVTASRFKKYL